VTREAKVGMLTGLGVIVLIGVLLSNYLDPHTVLPGGGTLGGSGTGNAESNATGQMAPLPVGSAYRKEVMSPAAGTTQLMAAPGMGAESATHYAMASGQAEPVTLVAGMDTNAGAGQRMGQAGPVIQDPVAPIAAGPMGIDRTGGTDGPPVVMVSQVTPGNGPATGPAAAPGPVLASVNYVIAPSDTLSKIAKKFYHDSKTSNVQKIVAANPNLLKDEHSPLMQGKTLVIPGVAAAAPVRAVQPMIGGVVPLPGDVTTAVGPRVPAPQNVTPAKKTYVVQEGDTLAKIARKLSPANATQMEKKLVSLNGIKDPDSLSAGTKLKVPA